jgi:AraC-like DNA-binding protein
MPYVQVKGFAGDPVLNQVQDSSGGEKTRKDDTLPDETDLKIFDTLNRLIVEKQIHLDPEISIDHAARMLGINRTYLSQAVNHITGDNFTAFINEYPIKEAVRLMSDAANIHITIEGIACDCGFNDRFSFYRVFKKSTGLLTRHFQE